jgi:hypothetical protein
MPDPYNTALELAGELLGRPLDLPLGPGEPESGLEFRRLAVVPEDVVHPGLLGGWVVSKPPVPRRTPDEIAR